jgi:hypothetical protein
LSHSIQWCTHIIISHTDCLRYALAKHTVFEDHVKDSLAIWLLAHLLIPKALEQFEAVFHSVKGLCTIACKECSIRETNNFHQLSGRNVSVFVQAHACVFCSCVFVCAKERAMRNQASHDGPTINMKLTCFNDSCTNETSFEPPSTSGISSRRLLFFMLLQIFVSAMIGLTTFNEM